MTHKRLAGRWLAAWSQGRWWEGATLQQARELELRAPESHDSPTLQGKADASVLVATTVLGQSQGWTVEGTE